MQNARLFFILFSLQCVVLPPHCNKVVGSIPRPWINSLCSFTVYVCVSGFSPASSHSQKTFHVIRLPNPELSAGVNVGADGCVSLCVCVSVMNCC